MQGPSAPPRHARKQAHDGQRRQRLAATGFADHAQDLAFRHAEAHLAHGAQNAGPAQGDIHAETFHLEQTHRTARPVPRKSRSESPKTLMASTRMNSATPGMYSN